MASPVLFPVPRTVDVVDDSVVQGPEIVNAHDPALPPQGYKIAIDAHGARLGWADHAGRRYGEATIDQLRRSDHTLPGVHISDWPEFVHRGYLLDVSRDRVPTRATLERLVERLATCRYNQLQLYIEHTFGNPDHRTVWADASPITPADLSWLDGCCADAGIELVVNQNTFGHFGRWLAHDRYRERAECPDGFEVVPGFRLPPTVLAPTAANAEFALDLVRAQFDCVTSRTVNVGCDETFELGKGASAARVAQDGMAAVYAEHLHRIIDPLIADGCAVQFWADVVGSHPEVLATLPETGCTPIVWNYDAPHVTNPALGAEISDVLATIGVDLDAPTDFATILEPFVASGRPFWVAPGTSTWQSLIGRVSNARANLEDAGAAGAAAGASGYLVTDWGDSGHLNPPAVSLAPIVYGGAVAWCLRSNRTLDVAHVVDTLVVHDPTGTVGGVLQRIGEVAADTGVVSQNASPLFQALIPSITNLSSGSPDVDAMRSVLGILESARDSLGHARPGSEDGLRLVDELDVAIGLAHHGARRMLAHALGDRVEPTQAARELAGLIERYRVAWLASSRPGGLSDSVAGLEATLARYRAS